VDAAARQSDSASEEHFIDTLMASSLADNASDTPLAARGAG